MLREPQGSYCSDLLFIALLNVTPAKEFCDRNQKTKHMLELLNVRFSFLCRTTRTNGEGKHPLVLRIITGGDRRDIFTGLYCHKEHWNNKAGRLQRLNKECAAINENLDLIQRKAFEVFEQMKYSGVSFTIDELVSKLKGQDEKPELLMNYLEEEKKRIKKRVGVDITPATYDQVQAERISCTTLSPNRI